MALIGNIEALGEWDPKRAVFMETSAASFPVWNASVSIPRDLVIEYKYIIV
jgi:hypothetical protein